MTVISTCVAAIMAVAPAGGWIVFVIVITTEAVAQAIAPASHLRLRKRASLVSNSLVMITPVIAEKVWPKKIARGCAKGASIAP